MWRVIANEEDRVLERIAGYRFQAHRSTPLLQGIQLTRVKENNSQTRAMSVNKSQSFNTTPISNPRYLLIQHPDDTKCDMHIVCSLAWIGVIVKRVKSLGGRYRSGNRSGGSSLLLRLLGGVGDGGRSRDGRSSVGNGDGLGSGNGDRSRLRLGRFRRSDRLS